MGKSIGGFHIKKKMQRMQKSEVGRCQRIVLPLLEGSVEGDERMIRIAEVKLWGTVEKVKCRNDSGGFGHDLKYLTKGKVYPVLGIAFRNFPDGSRMLCYIMADDRGVVSLKSTRLFEIYPKKRAGEKLMGIQQEFSELTGFRANRFHPLVWLNGEPKIGRNVYIGFFSVVNAKGAHIEIGDDCDIAPFVAINCADSHKRCIGLTDEIERKPIVLENNVFVGSHSVIKGGAHIGHHSVVAADTVVDGIAIPPWSLVSGNPMSVKPGYYTEKGGG